MYLIFFIQTPIFRDAHAIVYLSESNSDNKVISHNFHESETEHLFPFNRQATKEKRNAFQLGFILLGGP